MNSITLSEKDLTAAITAAVTAALSQISAPIDTAEKATKEPKAPKVTSLKPLSHGEIKALRRAGAEWVSGKADWQLQGRTKPANAKASGRVVAESVLKAHGYCRPTNHVRDLVKGA